MPKFTSVAGLVASSTLLVSHAASADFYIIGDGVAETAVGVIQPGSPNEAIYLNTFCLTTTDTAINQISIAFGAPGSSGGGIYGELIGRDFIAVLYSDPNGGTPWDGTLVWSGAGTITSTASFIDISVPNVAVAGNFSVGFWFATPAISQPPPLGQFYPAGLDTSAPVFDRSYVGYGFSAGLIDLSNLSGSLPPGQFGTIESFDILGNWTITANGVPAPGAVVLIGVAGLVGSRRRR
jgi:MYXO-CTERM domain-containing protein